MAKTITIETTAWLTEYGRPEDIHAGKNSTSGIGFASHDMSGSGWSRIGPAIINIECADMSGLIANKVEALKTQEQTILADAESRATEIRRQIQTLLAITNEASDA